MGRRRMQTKFTRIVNPNPAPGGDWLWRDVLEHPLECREGEEQVTDLKTMTVRIVKAKK